MCFEKIHGLLENMEDELEDAEKYAHKAISCMHHHDKADVFIEIAEEELTHYTKLEGMLKEHLKTLEGDLQKFAEMKHIELSDEYVEVKHLIKKASET